MRGPRSKPSSRMNNKKGRMLNIIVVIAAIIIGLLIITSVVGFIKGKVAENKGMILTIDDIVEISNNPSFLTADLVMEKNLGRNIKNIDEHSTMIKLKTEVDGVIITAMSVDPITNELVGLMITRPGDKEVLNLIPDNSKHIKDFIKGDFTEGLNK